MQHQNIGQKNVQGCKLKSHKLQIQNQFQKKHQDYNSNSKKYISMTCVGGSLYRKKKSEGTSQILYQSQRFMNLKNNARTTQIDLKKSVKRETIKSHNRQTTNQLFYFTKRQNSDDTKCNSELLSKPETPIEKLAEFNNEFDLKKIPTLHNINELEPKRMKLENRRIAKIINYELSHLN